MRSKHCVLAGDFTIKIGLKHPMKSE